MWTTNRDGLWRLSHDQVNNGQWRHYGKADGLLSNDPYLVKIAADGSLCLNHRFDAGIERVKFQGDRIIQTVAVLTANPQTVDVTAFHGFDSLGHLWRGSAN